MTLKSINSLRTSLNDRYFYIEKSGQEYYADEIEQIIGNKTIGDLMAGVTDEQLFAEIARQGWQDEPDGVQWALEALGEHEVYKLLEAQMPDHVDSPVAAKYTLRPVLTAFNSSVLRFDNA